VVLLGKRNSVQTFTYRQDIESFGTKYRFTKGERSQIIVVAQMVSTRGEVA
jgi:hypothetical protein